MFITMYKVKKDSHWAWMVCLGSFLSQLTIDGIGNSFGVVIVPLVLTIDSSIANVSWIKSVHTTFMFLFAFLSSIMIKKFGFRIVIWIGTLISCTAFISSAFLGDYVGLFMSYGILGGAGIGILFVMLLGSVLCLSVCWLVSEFVIVFANTEERYE